MNSSYFLMKNQAKIINEKNVTFKEINKQKEINRQQSKYRGNTSFEQVATAS